MISVIVPTLNEARRLPRLLSDLKRETTPHEVIVVDGGSADGTVELACESCAAVVHSARGRGSQLAAGGRAARGDILLFLHADTVLPPGGLAIILAQLAADRELVGGNFRVVFDVDTRFCRWVARRYDWWRGRGRYYGDSAIFVRAEVYREIGGIRPLALMEDYDFARRLERRGRTCWISKAPVVTSARRFVGRPVAAVLAGWIAVHLLYWIGIAPERLARLYRSESTEPASPPA